MAETLLAIADIILYGATILALVLGLSCVVMAFMSNKKGVDAMKERIEYGFMGVSGVVVFALLAYAVS